MRLGETVSLISSPVAAQVFQPCAQMEFENYSQDFLQAIDRALAFPPGDRPQSVAAWRQLVAAGAVDWEAETVAVSTNATSVKQVDFALEDTGESTVPAPAADTHLHLGSFGFVDQRDL